MSNKHTHFGPMHGERTRRHQFVIPPDFRSEVIVSVMENPSSTIGPALAIELYDPVKACIAADLTVDDARHMRDYLTEFIDAYGGCSR